MLAKCNEARDIMDTLIEGITQIANNKQVIEKLEPDVFSHQEIKEWMVKRVLYAFLLINEEFEKGLDFSSGSSSSSSEGFSCDSVKPSDVNKPNEGGRE